MKNHITDDDIFFDSMAEVISIISILSDFLLEKQKKVLAMRLQNFSVDLGNILKNLISVGINHNISIQLFIKSNVAIKECIDYLALINYLGYFNTDILLNKLLSLKSQILSRLQGGDSDIDISSINF